MGLIMITAEPLPAAGFAVETSELTFSYDSQPALDGLSLSIAAGALYGLLGPNGSGKSTLLSILAGLRTPDDGVALTLGQHPSPGLRARIGFLFQETCLDPLMTANETLALHGSLYGMSPTATRLRTAELLAALGLEDRAGSFVRTLSGGMKRRLELARALLPRPELLLLDEPTTGLDPDSEQALWHHLMKINRGGVTIVLSTNKVREAEQRCDTVAFIHKGRVAAQGSPRELKAGLKRDAIWAEGSFAEATIQEVRGWPDVGRLTWAAPVLHATVDSAAAFVPRFFQAASDFITAIRLQEATLEDAYFEIVGAAVGSPEGDA